jgi:iron complex outermembrane recepter protein
MPFVKRSTAVILLILGSIFLIHNYSFAQTLNLYTGNVVDSESGSLISDVNIELRERLEDNQYNTLERIKSDDDGSFTFRKPNGVQLELVFTHPQYLQNIINLTAVSDPQINVQLVRAESIRISGQIRDGITGRPIPDAQIQFFSDDENIQLSRAIGITTNRDGEFSSSFNLGLPFQINVTHISYHPTSRELREVSNEGLDIRLAPRVFQDEELVVLADMVSKEELGSINSIARVSSVDVQQLTSFDAFDLISNLVGVDVATQSMNMQSVSTRGFNTGANARFLQLTDGVDNQAPGLGFPIGNLLGPSELDIASMDMMIGPASSTYGPSAMSGVLNIQSRDPFTSPGFSMQVKGGVNDLRLGGSSEWAAEGDGMLDLTSRFAHVFGDRLAFKVTGTWLSGTDWRANNYKNIGTGEPWETHRDVAGYNGINIYGDEAFTYLPVGVDRDNIPNQTLVPVTRTGFREEDLVNYDIETRKLASSLHYKVTNSTTLKVEGRYGYTNTLYTDDSRVRLEDFEILQLSTELKNDTFFIRGYNTRQNSGNSYDVYFMANQLQQSAKSDENWFRDFRLAFENGIPIFNVPSGNQASARNFADSGFTLLQGQEAVPLFEPGSEEFNAEFERLRNTYDFSDGAGIQDNSNLYHIDSGLTLPEVWNNLTIEAGTSFRFYDLDSGGTIFPDTTGNKITNYEFGVFISGDQEIVEDKVTLNTSLRFDKNENFAPSVSPQFGLGYNLNQEHFFRFSYQYGFRFPSVREQFMNQNIGRARILGGLSRNTDPYDLQRNSITEQSVNRFNDAVIDDINLGTRFYNQDLNQAQVELQNLQILESGIIGENGFRNIKPEKTHAFEIGYRHLFNPNFFIDINYYVNFYRDFIGLSRVLKPRTSPSTDLFTAAGQINNSVQHDKYFVYTNSADWVTIHGLSFDFKQQAGRFFFGANGTITQLIQDSNDPIVPGFNTPPIKFNLEWGNRAIAENVGFKMVYRHRTSHEWQSPFLDGRIDQYGHFDFQLNVGIPGINSMIKTGFTNMGVEKYNNVFGGPSIGTIVFTTFTYNPGMF